MADMRATIDWLKGAADLVLSVGGALLLVLATAVFGVAFFRAWRQSRRVQVTIEDLSDATADTTTEGAVLGLTYRLREEVLAALPALADRARRAVAGADSDPSSPIRALMLEDIDRQEVLGDITSSQKDLMQSMESMVPQGARGAYKVVASSLLRPKEVRVLGVLQRRNDASGGLGVSFHVNHVGAEEAASRITLWEDAGRDVSGKMVAERFHALVTPAARALACELLRQRLRVKMSRRRRHRKARSTDQQRHVDREAVVEFLVGGSYRNAAHGSAPAVTSFYDLAARAFTKSAGRLDHYKLSYQLGNTLAELARRQGADRKRAIELLMESTTLLDQAEMKLPRADLEDPKRRAEELKIQAARATNACLLAEFLPDDEVKAKSAALLACALTDVDPTAYDTDSVLYNVACALAVAARVAALARHGADKDRCLDRSRLWLLHACARNDRWWEVGEGDSDLCLLSDWMLEARRLLSELSSGSDGLSPPDAEAIRTRVDGVLEALRGAAV